MLSFDRSRRRGKKGSCLPFPLLIAATLDDGLHPGADEGDQLAEEKQAVVAMAECAQRMFHASRPNLEIDRANRTWQD